MSGGSNRGRRKILLIVMCVYLCACDASELSEKSRQLWVEQSESRELHTHLDRTEKKLAQSQEDKEKVLTDV